MNLQTILFLIVSISSTNTAFVQDEPESKKYQLTWKKLDSGTDASFRGLSAVDEKTFWVSGSKGTVLRSIDGGTTFEDVSVPNCEELDFRDIHAFDSKSAVVMNAGTPGAFFRTGNGGKTWRKVYDDRRPEVFFDAMDFWDEKNGIAFGDAINGRLCVVITNDSGQTWREIDRQHAPKTQEGEGGFAASGTCLIAFDRHIVWIGTGSHLQNKSSDVTRLLMSPDRGKTWTSTNIPLQRNQSSGIFSCCRIDNQTSMVVGGDYTKPDDTFNNFAITNDGGRTWTAPTGNKDGERPTGFRSVAVPLVVDAEIIVVAAGTNGADIWQKSTSSWRRSTDLAINVLAVAPDSKTVFGAGPKGSVVVGHLK